MAAHRRLVTRIAVLSVIGVVLLAASAPAAEAKVKAPKAQLKELTITDFGVAAHLKLKVPLERTASSPKILGAGLVLAIEHDDGSLSGAMLLDSPKRGRTKTTGRLGSPVVVMTAGRDAWAFAAATGVRAAVFTEFVALPDRGGARASFEGASETIANVLGHWQVKQPVIPEFARMLARGIGENPFQRCDTIARQVRMAEEALKEQPTNPYPPGGSDGGKNLQWKVAAASLKRWLARARAFLADNCPPKSGTSAGGDPGTSAGGGDAGSSNKPPTIDLFVPPTSGKAGVPESFDAKVSDPDGQVTSWKWDWGDGTSTSGTGPAPKASHTYGKPKIYEVRLTVTDDKGASTTSEPDYIAVSAAGSKDSDQGSTPAEEEANKDFEFECPPVGFIDTVTLIVRIPSYADSPEFKLEPDPMCVGAADIKVTGVRSNGNAAGTKDAWGNFDDTYTVTIKITGAGAGGEKVHPVATVTWK